MRSGIRSLNLATAVGIVLYDGLRRTGGTGAWDLA
jgi:tRNA(Leu) C34 or U34 (ribose-2'-O)-methylase TrmL